MGNNCYKPKSFDNENRNSTISLRNNMLLTTTNRDVNDYYEVIKVLGEGSMGSVSSARKKSGHAGGSAYKKKFLFGKKPPKNVVEESNKKVYALKSILLSKVSSEFLDELRNEITVLQNLDHPNIVKAYEVYESTINIYLVLENCSGGDLYSRGPYSEKAAAKIVGKLLSAIVHMHQHGCTHRDLKYENVMFESRAKDAEIKLIDFGLANKAKAGDTLMTAGVGTIYTIAPEVLVGEYTSQVDLWSIGVMAYMLVSSSKPFHEKRRSRMIVKIKSGDYDFNAHSWSQLSQESKDFVKALIVVDPDERLNGVDALNHQWLSEKFPLKDRIPSKVFLDSVEESISDYGEVGEFKKMALLLIAHKSSSSEIVELRKAFDAFDTTNDGVISLSEFKAAMSSSPNYVEEDVEKIFKTLDTGNDGQIYYTEFLAATLEAHGRIVEETLADAFDRMDSDDTGYISIQNLREFLGKDASDEKVAQLMKEADLDGDGKITFEEFLISFRNSQKIAQRDLELDDDSSME